MSARLSANASLTPSPVIATTSPCSCNACTTVRFCSGETRPKTFPRFNDSEISSTVVPIVRASIGSWPSRPTTRAIAPTVCGLSPEITMTRTPCWRKYVRVSAASSRTSSRRRTIATGERSGGRSVVGVVMEECATSMTRRPVSACVATCARSDSLFDANISGAPRYQVPRPS